MIKARPRLILTHSAAVIIGAIASAALLFVIRVHISRDFAMMKCYAAEQSYDAGKYDEAIFRLGEARAEDRRYYEPLNLLAKIYVHKGNKELALESYKQALMIFDREGDPALPPRGRSLTREIISNKIDELQKQLKGEDRSAQRKS